MTIFTVHVPRDPVESLVLIERMRFVPEGFSWGAFLFGPLWLLRNRLWLAFVLWMVAMGLVWLLGAVGFHLLALFVLALLVEFFLGLEGNHVLAASLRKRGLVLRDVVAASGYEAAAQAFFQRSAAASGRSHAEPKPPEKPADPDEFVGLSPDAGG